jgi:hypothetical protein
MTDIKGISTPICPTASESTILAMEIYTRGLSGTVYNMATGNTIRQRMV